MDKLLTSIGGVVNSAFTIKEAPPLKQYIKFFPVSSFKGPEKLTGCVERASHRPGLPLAGGVVLQQESIFRVDHCEPSKFSTNGLLFMLQGVLKSMGPAVSLKNPDPQSAIR